MTQNTVRLRIDNAIYHVREQVVKDVASLVSSYASGAESVVSGDAERLQEELKVAQEGAAKFAEERDRFEAEWAVEKDAHGSTKALLDERTDELNKAVDRITELEKQAEELQAKVAELEAAAHQ